MNRGFHHVELATADLERAVPFYQSLLGLRRLAVPGATEAGVALLGDAGGRPGTVLALVEDPQARRGGWGVGGVHHVALGVETEEALLKWKRRLTDAGVGVTGPYDRGYFTSLYFTDPDGQILEIATAGPGYAVDEAAEALGRELKEPSSELLRGNRDEAAIAARSWPEPVPDITSDMELRGLHHVSAITDDLDLAVDWFPQHLGLELVKRTVNRDDARTLHYFWAVYDGLEVAPHSALTLFGWPGSDYRSRPGTGQTRRLYFAAPGEGFMTWRERLLSGGVDVSPVEPLGPWRRMRFRAPDGLPLGVMTGDAVVGTDTGA